MTSLVNYFPVGIVHRLAFYQALGYVQEFEKTKATKILWTAQHLPFVVLSIKEWVTLQ